MSKKEDKDKDKDKDKDRDGDDSEKNLARLRKKHKRELAEKEEEIEKLRKDTEKRETVAREEKINSAISRLAGDDKELAKKVRERYDTFKGDPEDDEQLNTRVSDAFKLAGGKSKDEGDGEGDDKGDKGDKGDGDDKDKGKGGEGDGDGDDNPPMSAFGSGVGGYQPGDTNVEGKLTDKQKKIAGELGITDKELKENNLT